MGGLPFHWCVIPQNFQMGILMLFNKVPNIFNFFFIICSKKDSKIEVTCAQNEILNEFNLINIWEGGKRALRIKYLFFKPFIKGTLNKKFVI
jgi:hypothetical protein